MSRKEPLRAVKGMRDILPPESRLWGHLEQTARELFHSYAYREIRTPLVEHTELFARGVGEETDIVTKEMYTWDDRDSKSLTLRPEATASVVRAFIEHKLYDQPGLKKLYYMGPMFRRERPQKGRYRQFFQIGAEAIGSDSPTVDAELIEMIVTLLGRLRLSEFTLKINSVGCAECRPAFLSALRSELEKIRERLCADCQRRTETNPLRVFDCKVPEDQPLIEQLPTISGSLCAACCDHFERLQSYLRDGLIPFNIEPRLVRGLDYYTRTTFEIVHGALGAQNALLGGGRYDGLTEALGGPRAPGIGFSLGEDRFVLAVEQAATEQSTDTSDRLLYIAWLGENAYRHAAELARELRAQHVSVEVAPDAAKLRRSLDIASRAGASHALIIGDNELAEGKYPLRDFSRCEQRTVSKDELFSEFAK
jgi:histidyl-tRNA synthetase